MEKCLSEVFLEVVGTDCTEEKIEEGMRKCEEILEKRLEEIPTEIGKTLYFLGEDGTEKENRHFREMLDLWDVIKEFAEEEKYRNLEIVKAGRILHGIHKGIR